MMPDLTKEQIYIILGIIAVVLIGCVVGVFNSNLASKQSSPETSPPTVLLDNKTKTECASCFVHISGAVAREGVYKLNKGDRIVDLLKLSGVASNADLDSVNLAELLSDGEKVFIPQKASNENLIEQMPLSDKLSSKANKIVNINTADEKELDSLPGIGPVMAKKIVDYRSEKGKFFDIEDLKGIPGISEKKFDKLKSLISVY